MTSASFAPPGSRGWVGVQEPKVVRGVLGLRSGGLALEVRTEFGFVQNERDQKPEISSTRKTTLVRGGEGRRYNESDSVDQDFVTGDHISPVKRPRGSVPQSGGYGHENGLECDWRWRQEPGA